MPAEHPRRIDSSWMAKGNAASPLQMFQYAQRICGYCVGGYQGKLVTTQPRECVGLADMLQEYPGEVQQR